VEEELVLFRLLLLLCKIFGADAIAMADGISVRAWVGITELACKTVGVLDISVGILSDTNNALH